MKEKGKKKLVILYSIIIILIIAIIIMLSVILKTHKIKNESISSKNEVIKLFVNKYVEEKYLNHDLLKIFIILKDNQLYDKVTSIDISNKSDYIVYMQNEKKTIHLGDASNLSNKMLYVIAILEQEKDVEGEIFANGELNSNFKVYFREKIT